MAIQRLSGGKQTDWQSIRAQTDQPIITIITSTYNVAKDLHWTIDSIKAQSYPHIQWIVADGASDDGTVEILQKHNELIDYWFSEPDTGIYDAWNKALEHVKGDWVQFIGAGDELYEPDTLTKVAKYLKDAHPMYDLVYGQVMHISEKGRKELFISGEPWEKYVGQWEGNRPKLPVQTGIYHHVTHFTESNRLFDTRYRIVADCHLLLQLLKNSRAMKFLPFIITIMPMGGISSLMASSLQMYAETSHSMKSLGLKIPIRNKASSYTKYILKKIAYKILSEETYRKLHDQVRNIQGKTKVYTVE